MSKPIYIKRKISTKEEKVTFKLNEPESKKFKFPESLLLGIIPVLVYGLMYAFESSYLRFFNIPPIYINFEWSEVLLFASLMLGVVLIINGLFNIPFMFLGSIKNPLARYRLNIYLYVSVYMLVLAYFGFQTPGYFIGYCALIGFLLFSSAIFISPLFRKYKGNYQDKLEQALLAANDTTGTQTTYDVVIHKFGYFTYLIIAVYLSSIPVTTLAGLSSAINKDKFYIIQSINNCAVVYTRTSDMLCVKFDKQKQEFSPGYFIYRNEDLKDVELVYEKIGPLHVKPTPTKTPIPTPTSIPTETPTATP